MGAKQSSSPCSAAADGRSRAYSGSDLPSSSSTTDGPRRTDARHPADGTSSARQDMGARARAVVRSESRIHPGTDEGAESERAEAAGPRLMVGSLPAHLSPHMFGGFKCPVCSKFVSSDDMDLHLVMCLTKPRTTYNEDVLSKDAGECAICLEELEQGDTIARLPCLCIYHKVYYTHFPFVSRKHCAVSRGVMWGIESGISKVNRPRGDGKLMKTQTQEKRLN
ncbi:E3 ubiquitin-protein ligase znrf2 isoform X1 [Synchiropus splendidus]|uniref:E3 ubiquitin-protein ligase znrf2 isoform X1 n=1 Tax=Synchiropus splendidus TaxID=270530 RepID=UPI00237EBA59|nr:E3 ubiquitin-protein ligase znrf2 isoform X1 [Synchiropus splendidus]